MKRLFNLGCGFSAADSFENYDASLTLRLERLPLVGRLVKKNARRFPANVQYGDIVKAPLCPDGFASAIFCSHVLEHMPLSDMRLALHNMHRMLAPGGVLRVIVPDLSARARRYIHAYDDGSPDAASTFLESSCLGKSEHRGLKGRLLDSFGNSNHLWMYDTVSFKRELEVVGFRNLRKCRFGDSAIKEFAEVELEDRFVSDQIEEVAFECLKHLTE